MAFSFIRNLLVVMALLGVFGQTTARAMPMEAFNAGVSASVEMAGCAEMSGMVTGSGQEQPSGPCEQMTADCIGLMGCASAMVLPTRLLQGAMPVRYDGVTYTVGDESRVGLSLSPELFPPIQVG